jgi:D-3-phosphoglycerate dehydrogenase
VKAPRVLITAAPFAQIDRRPFEWLDAAGIEHVTNPYGRRLTESELANLIPGFDALIASTEPITARVMSAAPTLRMISRVGIGLDSVDLIAARRRGICVAYTPDAPAPAVAELTIGLMVSLLRSIHVAHAQMRAGEWQRLMGRRLSEMTVGILGVGRIGARVIRHLSSFGCPTVANDLVPNPEISGVQWMGKEDIYRNADLISLHLPLTKATRNLIGTAELAAMRPGSFLVNTSRGGIVNEAALASALRSGHLAGAALDVFCEEPYAGELIRVPRCLLTSHMGSMTEDCRARMETEATENLLQFFKDEEPRQLVPESEYELQLSELQRAERNG